MTAPKETRILALERKQAYIGTLLNALRLDVTTLNQEMWDAWGEIAITGTVYTADFSGTLYGCGGAGVSGVVIALSTGDTVTSGSGGAFSGSVTFTTGSSISVTMTTSASSSYYASSNTFTLTAGATTTNIYLSAIITNPPTINGIGTKNYCGFGSETVSLSGITDGNGGTTLPITVSATSSNTSVVPNPTVSYTSPNTTGTLTVTPSAPGTVRVYVNVLNNGPTTCGSSNSATTTFTANVGTIVGPPTVTASPTSLSLTAGGATQTITFSGAGFGPNPGGVATSYTVSIALSNPGLLYTSGTTSYSSPTAGGTFTVGGAANASGTALAIVSITTNAPLASCTTRTTMISIPCTVS